MSRQDTMRALEATRHALAELPAFDQAAMETALRQLADSLGLKAGQLFGAIRVAVTGRTVAPPLFGSLELVGRERVLARLRRAEELLVAEPA